jgi:glycine cleavage system H protein
MVATLALITILVCIAIDIVYRRRAGAALASAQPTAQVVEPYFYPGHSWAVVKDLKHVIVGVDDLVPLVMGKVDGIEIAERGAAVHRGDPLVVLHSGTRSLRLASPLSGIVEETNTRLSQDPSLLEDSPYKKGWVARIAPGDLSGELQDLLNGAAAREWHEAVQIHLSSWFSPRLEDAGVSGQQVGNLISFLSDEEWKALTQALFFTGPFKRSRN